MQEVNVEAMIKLIFHQWKTLNTDFQVKDVMMVPFLVLVTTKEGDGVTFEITLEQVIAHVLI